MTKEYTIKDLFAEYVEVAELVRNRPDAVIVTAGKPKGRSYYQTKLHNIIRAAGRMQPSNPEEEYLLNKILGINQEVEV